MYAIFYAGLFIIAALCSATLVWNDPDRASRL
jgi:hypothetical protein